MDGFEVKHVRDNTKQQALYCLIIVFIWILT